MPRRTSSCRCAELALRAAADQWSTAQPKGEMTGWFLWAGEEMPKEPDAFDPLHVKHLPAWCPAVLPFLELPPGWRFLVAPEQEDLWFDEEVDTSWG